LKNTRRQAPEWSTAMKKSSVDAATHRPALKSLFIDSLRVLFIFCAIVPDLFIAGDGDFNNRRSSKTQQLAMFTYCALGDYGATVSLNR
jgi:hypothetical protein